MTSGSDALNEFERLRDHADAHQRGFEFQAFVANLFNRDHFRVVLNPGASKPRQVDLLANRGSETYLIETKWRKTPATINDIDSLFTRVRLTEPSVIGVMVSFAGFTKGAIEGVRSHAERPVLLVTGNELEKLVRSGGDLHRVLAHKKEALAVQRHVLLDQAPDQVGRTKWTKARGVPSSSATFVFPDGGRTRSLTCVGSFGQFVFARTLPDVDWGPASGVGVTFDLNLAIEDEAALVDFLDGFSDMGWTTSAASWSIQQKITNWHGLGPEALVSALCEWESRYEDLPIHHTEELCYFDEWGGGFYTLTARLAARTPRLVRGTRLSFQLEGIPLDVAPFQQLCSTFDVHESVVFRPRSGPSVSIAHCDQRPVVAPVAYVVEPDPFDPANTDWVAGLVVENPLRPEQRRDRGAAPNWFPEMAIDSELLVCDLRSWHPLSSQRTTYRLWNCESAWTSDAAVLRFVADWDEELPPAGEMAP